MVVKKVLLQFFEDLTNEFLSLDSFFKVIFSLLLSRQIFVWYDYENGLQIHTRVRVDLCINCINNNNMSPCPYADFYS